MHKPFAIHACSSLEANMQEALAGMEDLFCSLLWEFSSGTFEIIGIEPDQPATGQSRPAMSLVQRRKSPAASG